MTESDAIDTAKTRPAGRVIIDEQTSWQDILEIRVGPDESRGATRLPYIFLPAEPHRPQLLFFAGFFSLLSLSSSSCKVCSTPTFLGMDLILVHPGVSH
jgi:hypothetical protein